MCYLTKEMWDVLEVTHEGTEKVRRERKNALIQEYEMCRMLQGESIYDVQKMFIFEIFLFLRSYVRLILGK